MKSLPTGTVTFLFTDIEGSTALVQQLKDAYPDVLTECRRLVRTAVQERGGQEFGTEGDATFAAFPSARDALLAALTAQQRILRHPWPGGAAVRVRMGLHTGEARVADDDYVGLDVHRAARVCAAGHGGQILLSGTVADLAARDLPPGVTLQDLGTRRLRDLKEPERLLQVVHPDVPADFPPLKALDARPNNLPIHLTSFVGRAREIAEVKRLLGDARLVTLTGSGGTGKTRLALQVAADVLDNHADGVWFVDFAPIADPAVVPKTVAATVGVPEQPGRDMTETLIDALRPESLLLVLDNCEHLVAACAHLADALLRACPNVRILATSREGLGVMGEITWRVPSLSVPDMQRLPPLDQFVQYEAVRLFIDRAVAGAPHFTVTNSNAPAVAQVCHRLDGIPLAIELAAARIKVLTVEQIAARLDAGFRLLTGGSRTAVPRQQTLRAAMDWSYALLSERARALLRRLSVFAGGWTLEGAEAVCSGESAEANVLDLLAQLVDKSLVVMETQDGVARYRLLETVRQYARDRLEESDEETEARTRHRDWYLSFAEQADQKRWGPTREVSLDWLEAEHDNLRAALEWSRDTDDSEATLRLAAALGRFWRRRGYWSEGSTWLEGALTKESGAPLSVTARALHGAGLLAWGQGAFDRATTLLEKSVAMFKTLGDSRGIISSLTYLSDMSASQGQHERAVMLAEQCLTLCREIGDREGVAEVLNTLGIIALDQGNYQQATEFFEESLALSREIGFEIEVAFALNHLGEIARRQGDYERAERLFEESLLLSRRLREDMFTAQTLNNLGIAIASRGQYDRSTALLNESLALSRRLGDKWAIAMSLDHLGLVAWYQGDYRRAAALLTESLALRREQGFKKGIAASLCSLAGVIRSQGHSKRAIALLYESAALCRELQDKEGMATSLEGLAECAAEQEQHERAARMFGAAQQARESIGAPLPLPQQTDYEQHVAINRAGLGDAVFTAAWAEGRAMTLEQAIEYALAGEEPRVGSDTTG